MIHINPPTSSTKVEMPENHLLNQLQWKPQNVNKVVNAEEEPIPPPPENPEVGNNIDILA